MENRVQQRMRVRFTYGMRIVPRTEPLLASNKLQIQEHSYTGSSNSGTEDPKPFDCESRNLDSNSCLIGVEGEDREKEIIKRKLLSGLMSLGMCTTVGSIQKNDFSSPVKKAKVSVFGVLAKAVEEKSGFENGNVQFAWFGASSKELSSILRHGFNPSINRDGSFGHGVYLSPDHFPLGCMNSAMADENGMRHLLYCRVILGKTEVVRPGSRQWHPSSQEFDCGVDHLVSPKKYIVWSTNINTHILPLYMISFTISSLNGENFSGVQRNSVSLKQPNSPRVTFQSLVSELAKFLSPEIMPLITKCVKDQREGKMTRLETIKCLRRLAGDELLINIVKAKRDMQINASIGFPENNTGARRNR